MELYYTIVKYVLFGLIGLCVGSFLNVVIYRVPIKMSLVKPNSHCPKCNYELKWYDNIPVVSYCILGGKCRSCKAHISFRYTAVEIMNTVLWLLCCALWGKDNLVYAIISALVCSVLIIIAFIDLETLLIFDRFQIMLLCLGAASVFFDKSTVWYSHLIGCAAGFLLFLLLMFFGKKIFKRDALGGGDVKLAAGMGLLLGWEKLILAVLIGSVVGSIVLVILKKRRNDEDGKEYPFGPFLVLGTLAAHLAGGFIISWYLGLITG